MTERGKEQALTQREAAEWFSVSLREFQKWPIKRFKRGRVVRYWISDLEAFRDMNLQRVA